MVAGQPWIAGSANSCGCGATRYWVELSDYYWQKKSPEQVTADLVILLNHYLPAWKKQQVMLIGFLLVPR